MRGLGSLIATTVTTMALLLACGGEERAPLRDTSGGPGNSVGGGSSGGGFADFDASATDDCGMPAGQSCECAELPFAEPPPVVWFVLDRSGSMEAQGKWGMLRGVVLDVVQSLGPRIHVAAAAYPYTDLGDECGPGRLSLPPREGDAPAGQRGATWNALRSVLTASSPKGGTPLSSTLRVVQAAIDARPEGGKHAIVLTTDGAPNCNPQASCGAEGCIPNLENIEGCPTGGSPNCCLPSIGGARNCLDDQASIDVVRELGARGVRTYVMGAPGSEAYAGLLDRLAVEGGTAREGNVRYYAVTTSDAQAFAGALSSIAARIAASCSIELEREPGDPGMVNVLIDGVAVPADDQGWALEGSTVTLLGASCNKVMSGEALAVRVIVGCPTITPN